MDKNNSLGGSVAEIVGDAVDGSGIRSARAKGNTMSFRFGSDEVRDLSDGQYPVEVSRCVLMRDDTREDKLKATVRKESQLKRQTNAAGDGYRPGSKKQWVEVRCSADLTRRVQEALARIPESYTYNDVGFPDCYDDVLLVLASGSKVEATTALNPVVRCGDGDTLRAFRGALQSRLEGGNLSYARAKERKALVMDALAYIDEQLAHVLLNPTELPPIEVPNAQ